MHASLDQVRDTTIDAVDAASGRASGLVTTGAGRLAGSIERGAEGLEGAIGQVADRVPAVSIEIDRGRGRRKWPLLLVAVVLIIAGVAVARRMSAKDDREESATDQP